MGGALVCPVPPEVVSQAKEIATHICKDFGEEYIQALKAAIMAQRKRQQEEAANAKASASMTSEKEGSGAAVNSSNLLAQILSASYRQIEGEMHVVYYVEVQHGEIKHTVRRKHSEFRALAKSMTKGNPGLPALKSVRGTPHDDDFIAERKDKLSEFLDALVSSPSCTDTNSTVCQFLAISKTSVLDEAFKSAFRTVRNKRYSATETTTHLDEVDSEGLDIDRFKDNEARMIKTLVISKLWPVVSPLIEQRLPSNELLRTRFLGMVRSIVYKTVGGVVAASWPVMEKSAEVACLALAKVLAMVEETQRQVEKSISGIVKKAMQPIKGAVKLVFQKILPPIATGLYVPFADSFVGLLGMGGRKPSDRAKALRELEDSIRGFKHSAAKAVLLIRKPIGDFEAMLGTSASGALLPTFVAVSEVGHIILSQQLTSVHHTSSAILDDICSCLDDFEANIGEGGESNVSAAVDEVGTKMRTRVARQSKELSKWADEAKKNVSAAFASSGLDREVQQVLLKQVDFVAILLDHLLLNFVNFLLSTLKDTLCSLPPDANVQSEAKKLVPVIIAGSANSACLSASHFTREHAQKTLQELLCKVLCNMSDVIILPQVESSLAPLRDSIPEQIRDYIDPVDIAKGMVRSSLHAVLEDVSDFVTDIE